MAGFTILGKRIVSGKRFIAKRTVMSIPVSGPLAGSGRRSLAASLTFVTDYD